MWHALEPSASSFGASKELCEFGSKRWRQVGVNLVVISPEGLEKTVN